MQRSLETETVFLLNTVRVDFSCTGEYKTRIYHTDKTMNHAILSVRKGDPQGSPYLVQLNDNHQKVYFPKTSKDNKLMTIIETFIIVNRQEYGLGR